MTSPKPPALELLDVARLFSGRRLTIARQISGLRKNGLAELIGKTPTAVSSYENGTKRPAPATVAQLCLALGVEPAFFLAGDGDRGSLPAPHFRSLRSTPQITRDQAYAYGLLVNDIATVFGRHVEFPDCDVPEIPVALDCMDLSQPEAAARRLRLLWRIPPGPIGHLVRLVENHGILVVFSTPQAASVDAFSFSEPARPIVLLNPVKDDYYRQRYDVAHELGHLVMHAEAEPGDRIVEDQANRFAAEFLMPAEEIVQVLPRKADWRSLMVLKDEWRVSMQALLYRARQLGVMSASTYENAMTTLSARGWRRREPGPMPAVESPSALPKGRELLTEGGYTPVALARECRVPLPIFEAATSRIPVRNVASGEVPSASRRKSADTGAISEDAIPLFSV
ncbi:XRE family transcriptional regulator [Micromonospora sp. C41]|uniref:helix-turn-helix domain-containing protein n=1 Tax=Micromonospora sp. C41 TaxID=2824878 RepID=UPI001B3622AF|nr:XRE family transcriptional regulator [Micromonospora sp. C41]